MPTNRSLWLGQRALGGEPLSLGAEALLRHAMALGSSGSGKTVFCKVVVEEAVRQGIPAICIDPQGDLCSLGNGALDEAELIEHGVEPERAAQLSARADVVVFTPGSDCGVPLCADPIDKALATMDAGERVSASSRTAAVVVGLLGFDLDSDDGRGLSSVIDSALNAMLESGEAPSLARLSEHLFAAEADEFASYARLLDPKKIRVACRRLARLDVGGRRALFFGGVPIDVDVLLGRDARVPVAPGKTRIAIVYLNTLHQQEDKDFFVAALVERLYGWMLQHPSSEPQVLFYIDEVAPFIPPVRKPSCKDGLSLLFKQARKYGVCCLMATQNPGDVDYRAMAQFSTWALGRLTTRQDLRKVEPTVKSLAPQTSDAILERLPSLKPGELVLISPDQLGAPVEMRARWLMSKHETWNEERIREHADGVRGRFEALIDDSPANNAERAPVARAEPNAPDRAEEDAEEQDPAIESEPPIPLVAPRKAREPEASLRRTDRSDREVLAALGTGSSFTAAELAARLSRHEATIRRALDRLVENGDARLFKEGRVRRYWAPHTGQRPDLRMPSMVVALVANVDADAAARIAAPLARSRVLGLLGEDERFARAEPIHRLVYKIDFEEKVERSLLGRIFGSAHDERLGSVYVHPHDLRVLVFTNADGIRFVDRPSGPASEIMDFDGLTQTEEVPPSRLALEDADWLRRKSEKDVEAHFSKSFDATVRSVSPLFVPLWQLLFESERSSLRRVTIDALIGRVAEWPPPV